MEISLPVVDLGGELWAVVFHVYNVHNPVSERYRLFIVKGEDSTFIVVDEATGRAILDKSNHRVFKEV